MFDGCDLFAFIHTATNLIGVGQFNTKNYFADKILSAKYTNF